MTVRYHARVNGIAPEYVCQRAMVQRGDSVCQRIPGAELDQAIGRLLGGSLTPLALEASLAVQDELDARADELERVRCQQVERARYETELAERRYRSVDPDHRLVAAALEADWNEKLRALAETQEACEREREAARAAPDEAKRAEILSLATDFPRHWEDRETSAREKKRMARLLIEDVTLLAPGDTLTAHVRFRGGATRTLQLPRPRSAWELRQTAPDVVREIDHLLDEHTEGEIARMLNERGRRSGEGLTFHRNLVAGIRRRYHLPTRYERLREKGLLDLAETAARLQVDPCTVKEWRAAGLLVAYAYNDKNQCLYEPPGPDRPQKHTWKGLSARQRAQRTRTPPPSCHGGAV